MNQEIVEFSATNGLHVCLTIGNHLMTTAPSIWRLSPASFASHVMDQTACSRVTLEEQYRQIPNGEEDAFRIPFMTPFGLLECTRMPFGMRDVTWIFCAVHPSRFGWSDDILISRSCFCSISVSRRVTTNKFAVGFYCSSSFPATRTVARQWSSSSSSVTDLLKWTEDDSIWIRDRVSVYGYENRSCGNHCGTPPESGSR